jgi:hypothetical protein
MDDKLLAIYLNDHLAAATGGLSLAKRARDAHQALDPELHRSRRTAASCCAHSTCSAPRRIRSSASPPPSPNAPGA